MHTHVTILAVLYLVFSLFGLLAAGGILLALGGAGVLSGDPLAAGVLALVAVFLALLLAVLALPGLLGAWGLFQRREWARVLVLVLGALQLINIPLGTILGLYTFWVLLQPETEALFKGH